MNWHYRNTVLALCLLAFFVTYFARLAISPVIPLITDDFGISNSAIGVAMTGMWLAYGLAQFPSGVLADRYGEKPIILLAVGGSTVVSLLLALAPVVSVFALAAVLLGGVAGLHYSVATALLSRIYDDIGRAIGFHSAGAPLAGLTAPVVATFVGVRYGWRPAVALTVLVGLPVFVLFVVAVRPTPPRRPDEPMQDRFQLHPLVELLSRPPIAFTLCIAMAGTFVAQGVLSFLPTFLVEHRGFSPTTAGIVFSGLFVGRAVAQIGIGTVSDRYSRDAALAGSMVAGGVGLGLLVVGPDVLAVTVGIALGATGSSFFAAVDPRFIDELSEVERGVGFGLVRTAYTVIGASGSLGVGLVADHVNWGASFTVLTVLSLVAGVVVLLNWALDLGY